MAATEVGGVGRLASLWRTIFDDDATAAARRPPGWFAAKLRRGHVVDELSHVAVDGDPTAPPAWRGFVLVGTPPSLHPRARTAGTGVVASCRGRGLGRSLLDAASDAAARSGLTALELLADPRRVGFYVRAGFAPRQTRLTLQATATGTELARLRTTDDAAFTRPPAPGAREWFAWSPEAWHGSSDRHAIDGANGLRALVSRVGDFAWLVHRWMAPADIALPRAAVALLDALPQGHAVLIPLVPTVSLITERLVPAPFSVAQRAELLVRDLPRPPH